MPCQQASAHAYTTWERFSRWVAILEARDPRYWVQDFGPDAVNPHAIVVGDHRWDVAAQRNTSRARAAAGPDGKPADAWLIGLARLGITPAEAAGYGFDCDPDGELAQFQAAHITSLRAETYLRPPLPPHD